MQFLYFEVFPKGDQTFVLKETIRKTNVLDLVIHLAYLILWFKIGKVFMIFDVLGSVVSWVTFRLLGDHKETNFFQKSP